MVSYSESLKAFSRKMRSYPAVFSATTRLACMAADPACAPFVITLAFSRFIAAHAGGWFSSTLRRKAGQSLAIACESSNSLATRSSAPLNAIRSSPDGRGVTDPQAQHDLSCAALAHTEEFLDRQAVEAGGFDGPQVC